MAASNFYGHGNADVRSYAASQQPTCLVGLSVVTLTITPGIPFYRRET